MSNYSSGHTAEEYAEKYLNKLGYKTVARNYKTRQYEIDIIAEYNKRLYFIEVKYRQTDKQGTGFDYITPIKLKQMQYAADFWVGQNNWSGEYVLGAIEVTGKNYLVTNFLPDIY